MADASYRYQQQSTGGPHFYNPQNHHRQLAHNASPVNSNRAPYANDTPSPSRSPVSQASSHLTYNMYNHNHLQGHNAIMNGNSHQRYQNMGMGPKYQHQSHHGHATHQNDSHQAPNLTGVNHQHNFSSGALSHNTPHFTNGMGNHHPGNEHVEGDDNLTKHRRAQLEEYHRSSQGAQTPHRHCKSVEAVHKINRNPTEAHSETRTDDGREERNRTSARNVIRRQDWDELDLSGQGLRAISLHVFTKFTFLRKLYMDHNALRYLDPAIGRLRLLTHLDISFNSIAEIPPEIGMLVNLETLLLFGNLVTDFPPEIGHLYKLKMLGIEGNQIVRETSEHIMEDGTHSYIQQVRENRLEPLQPPPRQWIPFEVSNNDDSFTVMSYNILCDKYATTNQYGYTPVNVLVWSRRRELILQEILDRGADVICLQEVDRESFQTYFLLHLTNRGYKGIFYPKSRAKTMVEAEAKLVDGCAIFYKARKYICLDKMVVDFGSTAINRQDMKGEHDIFNRVMPRDNISVVAFLENRESGARFMIGNAHIYWDPTFADVKLVQVAILMEAISKRSEEWAKKPACADKGSYQALDEDGSLDPTGENTISCRPSMEYTNGTQIPLIICGDFNSDYASGVHELLTQGQVAGDHPDLTSRSYGKFTREGIIHPFKLKSAYGSMDELNFTNYTPNFTGVIDYIWYSYNAMEVKGLLGNVDEEYLKRVPGFPSAHFPSDHVALNAEFAMKPGRLAKTAEKERS